MFTKSLTAAVIGLALSPLHIFAGEYSARYITNGVNIRSQTSTKSTIVCVVNRVGQRVHITPSGNPNFYITYGECYGNNTGYVHKSQVTNSNYYVPSSYPIDSDRIIMTKDIVSGFVWARVSPKENARVNGTFLPQTDVKIFQVKGNWAYVKNSVGVEGWVKQEYLAIPDYD